MSEEINRSFSVVFSGRREQFRVQTLAKGVAANYSQKYSLVLAPLYHLHKRKMVPALGRFKLPAHFCLLQLEKQSFTGCT